MFAFSTKIVFTSLLKSKIKNDHYKMVSLKSLYNDKFKMSVVMILLRSHASTSTTLSVALQWLPCSRHRHKSISFRYEATMNNEDDMTM